MKKMRKLLSVLLAFAMLTGTSFVFATISSAAGYQVGDLIEFGTYPQTRVEDEAVISKLNAADKTWRSYGYYSGTGDPHDGKMTSGDYMQFADFFCEGMKYRAVTFSEYRPSDTGDTHRTMASKQYRNNYFPNQVYYFQYEPLIWRVLDPATGYVMCENLIDAQAYHNTIYYDEEKNDFWQDFSEKHFPNDYANSSIRQWLNNDFYHSAFTDTQKENIKTTELNNDANDIAYAAYNSAPTNDQIFLLSWADVLNPFYGFNPSYSVADPARDASGTDYAKCQGLDVNTANDINYYLDSWYYLRSPGFASYGVCVVKWHGTVTDTGAATHYTSNGIRPACILASLQSDNSLSENLFSEYNIEQPGDEPNSNLGYHAGDMIEFGSYPQKRIIDESLIATLEEAAAGLEWQSLGYEVLDQEPFAFYKDVEHDGVRYRAQRYTAYRSSYSGRDNESGTSSMQRLNGYGVNTTYWFQYEPIQWKVLDPEAGLLFPEMILDSQAINTVMYNEEGNALTGDAASSHPGYIYADAEHQYYLNNYANSDVRDWLNTTFMDTAFSAAEQTVLVPTEIDNSVSETDSESYMQYGSENTNDAVFLLSYGEAAEEAYFADNTARSRMGTDYAKAQGLNCYKVGTEDPIYRYWYLRSPSSYATYHGFINDAGTISGGAESIGADMGICPAVTISLAAYDALNNDSPDVQDEPDSPTSSPYDDFTFSFANGILTVSGSGTLPTVDDLSQTPLAQYAQDCAVIIMEDGNKTVSSGAFAGFEKLSILVINSPTVLENGAFEGNENLQTVICSETANLSGNPFAAGTDVALYEAKSKPHTGTLPANCQTLPYSFSDGTLHVEGDAAMDTYGLLDLMAVMCGYYEDINYVKFRSYTSLDIPFYVFNAEQKQYVALEENTLNGVSFSIKIFGEEDWETVTFNYFCAHAQDHDLGSFRLVAQTENGEDVQESSFRIIDQIQTFIKRALKWIVSLLNFMFKVLSSFRK